MENENRSYRIRTEVGNDAPNVINVKLNQTFDTLDILSLKIGQKNLYKMPAAPYGVVCGRVLLGGKSFGIQNAKVSIFIPKDSTVFNVKDDILYTYSSVDSVNYEGVRYNLLPSYVDNACHQNVGTMFEKEYVLDNNDVIRIFDNYYTYTTSTNNAGDYFIYGVPVGQHTLHVDVDLSDIGPLSVRPHDMIGQGYNIDQFESPNKFKADKNLNILSQVKTQNKPVYIYPFWGDTTEDDTNALITRADIEIDYKFEPSAVFIGSIVTDKGSNSISHKCIADDKTGKMSELITGEGRIEMIRKTFDGKVEQFSVKGNRLIDGDGVWCYQVPMNLDYVSMDEFGNIVPTDNPEKGIPTRARVRFRISLDESIMDDSARKRARFLVPNNPRLTDDYPDFSLTHEADYEFGTFTKEESYRDMFWNNVYTVKGYVPRLQKRGTTNTKKFTGIKMTNHAGDNNPAPFNNLSIKMGFVYRFLCVIISVFLCVVFGLNTVLTALAIALFAIGNVFYGLYDALAELEWLGFLKEPFLKLACTFYGVGAGMTVKFDSNFCDDGGVPKIYIIGPKKEMGKYYTKLKEVCSKSCNDISCPEEEPTSDIDTLLNCVQNSLAQDNEVTSFNFHNDWLNGTLYAPLWYRKIRPKRRLFFGLVKVNGTDDWCDGNSSRMSGTGGLFTVKGLKLCQTCAQQRRFNTDSTRKSIAEIPLVTNLTKNDDENGCYGAKCHEKTFSLIQVDKGIIIRKETKYGEYVYYYKSVEYDANKLKNIMDPSSYGEVKLLFATDMVLLGSLNDCDTKGIPQFFKHLTETTYNMPPDLLSLSWNVNTSDLTLNGDNINESGAIDESSVHSEYSGADYGNAGWDQNYKKDGNETKYVKEGGIDYSDGGLFYGLNCLTSYVVPKSCINLSRVCEFGVTLDQSITFGNGDDETIMPPDGFISYDEMYNPDARAMFATMNGNGLRVHRDLKTGFPTYDFNYLYPENFDGTVHELMKLAIRRRQVNAMGNTIYYRNNYKLEQSSDAYLRFRYGYQTNPWDFKIGFYDSDIKLGWFADDILKNNYRRFPRYENSFYFYFGLKSGKTAIDKFRNSYYAECTNDAESENGVVIDYVPNTWCNDNDTNKTMRDGYIAFDLSNLEHPCSIEINDRNHLNNANDSEIYTEIHSYKLYIGLDNRVLNNKGYDRLFVDEGTKKQKPAVLFDNSVVYTPAYPPANDYYMVTITDANGETYRQNISFESPNLKYDTMVTSFTLTNDELSARFEGYPDPINSIAEDTTPQTDSLYKRAIGGYITVTAITNGGEPLTDDFTIRIKGSQTLVALGYNGSDYSKINGVVDYTGARYISDDDGEIVFGVPMGDEHYIVTVTQYCANMDAESRNSVSTRVYISQPTPFKMFVNGIDTDMLAKFNTGFEKDTNGVINTPYTGYNETTGITPGHVIGWLDINDIGVDALIQENSTNVSDIQAAIDGLTRDDNTLYKFTDEYTFEENDVYKELDVYETENALTEITGQCPKYVRVKRNGIPNLPDYDYNPFDEVTYIYEYNAISNEYEPKFVDGERAEDITTIEYFTMGPEQAHEVISVLNEIIQRRLDLVDGMIDAFWMYDANEENKTVTVTYQTAEAPVKTLIYYIPDTNNAINESFGTGSTGYELLDVNKDENTITSFSNPTITHSGASTKPVFFKYGANGYKLPPYCGIKNKIDVTVPNTLTGIPFQPDANNIPSVMALLPGGMDNMFGFHIIDKRPFTEFNIWIPMSGWAVRWPDLNQDAVIDVDIVPGAIPYSAGWFTGVESIAQNPDRHSRVYHVDNDSVYREYAGKYYIWDGTSYKENIKEGDYISLNGCVAGYFYNGFSVSGDKNALFVTQKMSENVGLYTVTVNNGKPDEFAVPTRRILYNATFPTEDKLTYNIYRKKNNPIENFKPEDNLLPGEETYTQYRYVSYNTDVSYFTVSDNRSTFNENLFSKSVFGIPEDTVVTPGTTVKPEFSSLNEGVTKVVMVKNTPNPVYQKVYDNNPELIVTPNVDMTYNHNYTLINTTVSIPLNAVTVFFVGLSSDGKYRGISPTYEVKKVYAKYENENNHPKVTIRFDDDNENDYYLRYYPFYIIIKHTQTVDGETVEMEEISELIHLDYDSMPIEDIHYKYYGYSFGSLAYIGINNVAVYIKDVTGIRRGVNYYNNI